MIRSQRSVKAFLTVAVAALALGALVASSASAAIVPAKFSNSSVKLTTTGVTLKRAGIEAKSCTLSPAIQLFAEGSGFIGGNGELGEARFTCGTSSLRMRFVGEVLYDTVAGTYSFGLADYTTVQLASPYGFYWQNTGGKTKAPWVNGSGATNSKITLSETPIGYDNSSKLITMSGTLTATTSAGGLVTLSH